MNDVSPCEMCELAHALKKRYHRDFTEENCFYPCKIYEDYLWNTNKHENLEKLTDIVGDK